MSKCLVQTRERAERVVATIWGVVIGSHIAFPARGYKVQGSPIHRRVTHAFKRFEKRQSLEHRLPGSVPLKLDVLEQLGEKLAHRLVAISYLLIVVVIRRTGNGVDRGDRGLHGGLLGF